MNSTNINEFCRWIYNGEKEKVVETIQQKNLDLNEENSSGMSTLIVAIEGGQPEILEMLLKNGAEPNNISKPDKLTALHWAVETAIDGIIQNNRKTPNKVEIECIQILLKYGADKNIKDVDGQMPFDYHKNSEVFDILMSSLKKSSDT